MSLCTNALFGGEQLPSNAVSEKMRFLFSECFGDKVDLPVWISGGSTNALNCLLLTIRYYHPERRYSLDSVQEVYRHKSSSEFITKLTDGRRHLCIFMKIHTLAEKSVKISLLKGARRIRIGSTLIRYVPVNGTNRWCMDKPFVFFAGPTTRGMKGKEAIRIVIGTVSPSMERSYCMLNGSIASGEVCVHIPHLIKNDDGKVIFDRSSDTKRRIFMKVN